MPARSTFNFNGILSHAFGNEECVYSTLFERFSNHHLTVRCARLCFDQFTKETIHDLTLSIQLNFTHQGTSIVHQFAYARFVGVTNIKMCLCNLLSNFMVEIFVSNNVIFRRTWATDNDGLNVLKIWQPIRTSMFGSSLEEIVGCFFNQAFETLSRLTTLTVFSHDVGDQMFLNVNALSRGNPVSGFRSINHKQTVGALVNKHVFKLR